MVDIQVVLEDFCPAVSRRRSEWKFELYYLRFSCTADMVGENVGCKAYVRQ